MTTRTLAPPPPAAPGTTAGTTAGATAGPAATAPGAPLTSEELRALALRHGLTVSGARPSLPAYVRQLWSRRDFITAFATARLTAQYSQARLGQIWQVMTPLLNAAVYYAIFGVLMNVKRGIPDYVPFLLTGVFAWTFTSQTIMTGTRAISDNMGLVRALHFPRASLPIALALQQLQQLLFSLGALVAILFCFGEFPRASWLLAIPALLCQTLFGTGLALAMARLAAKTPDIAQLMPFVLRSWMYASGVMWSIPHLTQGRDLPHGVIMALRSNPAAVYIDLLRFAFVDSFHASQLPPHVWALAAGWAALAFAGGFVYFWKAEETYGRG
ncbi:ABC-2 type transporter [Streptomyces laurentii]|uniref:Transport permease protein n=1 Tax=Streptomyces laurentii TaxID=39478 RepID=A0A160NXS3_STRLU|nr:ABC-2 type transporter [Streptomyces laurentii]